MFNENLLPVLHCKIILNQAPKISRSGWLGGTNMLITTTEHNKLFKEVYIICRKGTVN